MVGHISRPAGERPAPRPLRVERTTLDALTPDPANARQHGDENLAAIKGSLARFGQTEPLVVQAGSGRIIGGHGRLTAMRELGWTQCDVIRLDIGDEEARALGIALNRTAELAEWDISALADLLESLRVGDGLDGVGFDETDLDALLDELAEEPDPREIDDPGPGEPPTTPVSRLGDLWRLGDHRLLCGDATKAVSYDTLLGDAHAALLATDPPYCIDYTGANRPVIDGKRSGKDWSATYREVDIADYGDFMDGVLSAVLPRLGDRAPIYVWHAHVQQQILARALAEHDVLFHQVIVWVKPTPVFGHSFFRWQHEPCAFGWRKGQRPRHSTSQMTTIWEVDWEGKRRVVGNEHPTQKPLRLFEIPMELHTRPGDIVLEPFSGSGSQLLAAERRGRRCYAMELCPAFVDVAVRRWERATGQQAALDATAVPFEDIATERLSHGEETRS